MLPDLAALTLDDSEMTLGADPQLLRNELLALIENAAINAPRSLQRAIGPSGLGTPCLRKLAYGLTETPTAVARRVAWLPVIGTAVHAWLAEALIGTPLYAAVDPQDYGSRRFLVETRVNVGRVNGVDIVGSADLYDRVTCTVVDHKVVGATTLRRARAGPSDTYRVQIHCYGRGFVRRGLPVERVAILYLPRNGDLREAVLWTERYDETVATQALQRADAVVLGVKVAGATAIIPSLPTADDYCTSCPWFRPNVTPSALSCPGHTDPSDR
jgi:hypothetical protein